MIDEIALESILERSFRHASEKKGPCFHSPLISIMCCASLYAFTSEMPTSDSLNHMSRFHVYVAFMSTGILKSKGVDSWRCLDTPEGISLPSAAQPISKLLRSSFLFV